VRKEVLMSEIRTERQRPTLRKRRRRFAAVLVPAALLAVAATGYVILASDEVVAAGIGCFDEPDLGANVTVVSTTGESPEEVCGDLWAQGVLSQGVTETPELVPCVHESGAIYVFPSDDRSICTRFGLQDLPDDYEREARRFVKMRDALVAEMYRVGTAGPATERNACLSEERSLQIARRVLSDHGFDDWTAEVATGDYQGRECANAVGFEDAEKKVLVIPTFRTDGIDPDPFGPH
jgi:hypothetical protein